MDFPSYALPASPIITPFSVESLGLSLAVELFATTTTLTGTASATWPANNLAFYYPFRLSTFVTVYQLLFWVGATSSGNIDVGIYDAALRRIVSAGSTAMSATVNTVQEINIADTVLPPGDYLLGVSCSTTVGTCFRTSANDEVVLCVVPVYEEALGSVTLPDPATPVLCTQSAVPIWVVGAQLVPTF